MRLRKPRVQPVKVLQIGRKGEFFMLMCGDGNVYRFDQDDSGLTLDVEAWKGGREST
jgi:hypothetical protein